MSSYIGRHLAFFVGCALAAAGYAAARLVLPEEDIVVAANGFFLGYLVLTAFKIPRLDAAFLKKHAAGADEPVWMIFLLTFLAVLVAVGSLFLTINRKEETSKALSIGLALWSVALGWFTIHTMAALHYAHLYWRPERKATGGAKAASAAPRGGLEFPDTPEPVGYDFLYFAIVIGMTAQTSDVQITSTGMRKLNLLHAVVSFFFNTVLLAAAVNLAVALGGA